MKWYILVNITYIQYINLQDDKKTKKRQKKKTHKQDKEKIINET